VELSPIWVKPVVSHFSYGDQRTTYLLVGVPLLFNVTLVGVLISYINAKFQSFEAKFDAIDRRFDAIDQRFDDMRELWRAELRRVEEVLGARLKLLERR
jgi:hypothetical protein